METTTPDFNKLPIPGVPITVVFKNDNHLGLCLDRVTEVEDDGIWLTLTQATHTEPHKVALSEVLWYGPEKEGSTST